MNKGLKTIIYPVKDAAKAKAVFSKLIGSEPTSDTPYYIGYTLGDQQIGLDPNGHASGMTGPIAYYHIDNMTEAIQELISSGAQVTNEPKEVGGGRMVAVLKDADGNPIGLIQDS